MRSEELMESVLDLKVYKLGLDYDWILFSIELGFFCFE
jgi:hypothetical protein